MSEIPVDPKIWELARHVCTQKQLTVLELREKHGFSFHSLAINLNCTRTTAKEHHRAATNNVLDAIESAGGINEALEIAQPRPTSEETPEEKLELDRFWADSEKKEIA
jgi:DNA-directed RNA polymerase specialized sigma24 family protein